MKEKWKVFIRGNKDRGEEVIKALEDCGASNPLGYIGDYDAALYFINHNGIIDSTRDYNAEFTKIIMDNYTELHLPEKWKDGDILTRNNNNNLFCVYQKPVDNGKGFLCYLYVTKDVLFTEVTVPSEAADNYRKATDSEKLTFYSLTNNRYLCWDAENKQLVKWKWKPKKNEKYWFVSVSGNIIEYIWTDSPGDKARFDFGNCFHTKEKAEIAAEKIKHLLQEK